VTGQPPFQPVIETLASQHDRATFDCGNDILTRYFRQQAGQDYRRHAAVPFVMVGPRSGKVAGYYTLSSFQIDAGELPPSISRRFPRYPHAPATLLGRLAIDSTYQGQGWGRFLLLDALYRSLKSSYAVASLAVVVDAIDDDARNFYERYGYIRFPSRTHRLFLPMDTIRQLFETNT
jgi:ribosomal protein S18 acetylase RimI-like enzyme